MKITIRIHDLAGDGSGIGLHGWKTVRVPFTLPGEEAVVQITANRPGAMHGRLLEVIAPSPRRFEPACPLFGACGGCLLQHADHDFQVAFKRRLVLEALAAAAGPDPVPEIRSVPSPRTLSFRNKMIFPVGFSNGAASLGFYRMRSHAFLPVKECPVAVDGINALIAPLNRAIHGLEAYNERNGSGLLRHVVVRAFEHGPAQVSLVLFRKSRAGFDIPPIESSSLWINLNSGRGNVILAGEWAHLGGSALQEVAVRGVTYLLHPGCFFQSNSPLLETTAELVDERLDPRLPVADLYGGAGFFGLQAARKVERVVVVEDSPLAILSGTESARAGGFGNVEFHARPAELAEPVLADLAGSGYQAVLDPPRKGCGPVLLAALKAHPPRRILYLSCNPASLARDIGILKGSFRLEEVLLLDFFPHTAHCETLSVLELRPE